jgi:HK97 family phage major capsid protein
MSTTDQLRSERDTLTAEAEEILARSESTIDGVDRTRFDEITGRIEAINAELADRMERAQRLTNLRGVVAETGDGAAAVGAARDAHLVRRRSDAEVYDRSGLRVDRDEDGVEYRERAMRAIEAFPRSIPAEWRESAERLVCDAEDSARDRVVADHILRCGSPDYVRGFRAWTRNPMAGLAALPEPQRAAMAEGANSTGGFMVPVFIDPTVILTNTGIANPIRSIATVKSIVTQTWKGVTSAGVTAEWTAEAAEMTDASPTVAQPSITPVRADAVVQASWEMFEDTSIGTELAMLFADARDRLEGTAFAVGTGATQPTGIVTALGLVTASRVDATTNAAFGSVDIFALDNAMGPRWRSNASWLANKTYLNRIRQFATGSGPQHAFWVDLGGGVPPQLIGYDVYESSAMTSTLSSATASSDDAVILGDFRAGYYIVDRVGMSLLFNQFVLGSNRRPTGESQWVAVWRVGGDTVVDEAFRLLRI